MFLNSRDRNSIDSNIPHCDHGLSVEHDFLLMESVRQEKRERIIQELVKIILERV